MSPFWSTVAAVALVIGAWAFLQWLIGRIIGPVDPEKLKAYNRTKRGL